MKPSAIKLLRNAFTLRHATRCCSSDLVAGTESVSSSHKKRNYPRYVDPNYPKRPLNGYMRFWLQFQPELMDRNKEIDLVTCAKIAGKEWYDMAESQRAEWHRESEEEWKRFQHGIKEYRDNDGFAKWKETKDALPNKTYPRSPLNIFIRHNFKERAAAMPRNTASKDIVRDLVEQWKALDESDKEQYREMWQSEKDQFLQSYGRYLRS